MARNENMEYFVNEEKKTVVAVLTVPYDVLLDEFENMLRKIGVSVWNMDGLYDTMSLNTNRFEGRAVCQDGDKWDVDTGIRVARLKALRKYTERRKLLWGRFRETAVKKMLGRIDRAAEYNDYSLQHIDDALHKYM